MTTIADYSSSFSVTSSPERVRRALTDTDELSAWWRSGKAIMGSRSETGVIRFPFPVAWTVEDCAVMPDWNATKPTFT